MHLTEELKNQIKKILDNDGVIAFVTDTVWGLGCLPNSKKAVEKIYEIKKREAAKPLILMSNEIKNLKPFVKKISPKAMDLIDKHFPGALTLVLEKSEKTPNYMTSGFDTVGIRIPDNKVFEEICEATTGHVLATTSANLSHQPSSKNHEQVLKNIGTNVDLILEDFGCEANGLESTVVLIKEESAKILRQGAIKL